VAGLGVEGFDCLVWADECHGDNHKALHAAFLRARIDEAFLGMARVVSTEGARLGFGVTGFAIGDKIAFHK
jgi:hypothetical protein